MTKKTDIILTTANARYSHCSFGLKRLWCALGPLQESAQIMEFTIQENPHDIAMTLLETDPRIIGFGVYIWNVTLLSQVLEILHTTAPDICLVLGGPEMVDRDINSPIAAAATYIIDGEGEAAFASLAEQILAGQCPKQKQITAAPPDLDALPDPYAAYTDEDIRQRVIYVESSRGCPYRCAFCLSARDERVRYFPLEPFLESMGVLLERGVRHFKFTDRTFNVKDTRVLTLLDFFLQHPHPDLQLHFEIMPDRLSDAVVEKMAAFPAKGLHLEVGMQSVSPETQKIIGRNQNIQKSMDTLLALRTRTGAALHADLIIGLPGDTRKDISRGFDLLVRAEIQEIQVGLLKRLEGTAIAGAAGSELSFSTYPPYEVLQTPALSYAEIQGFKRFARYFNLYYNNGNFPATLPLLWETADTPFAAFTALTDWVWEREQRVHQLPLTRLTEHLYRYLLQYSQHPAPLLAQLIENDFRRLRGRRDKLPFLEPEEVVEKEL